MDNALSNQSFYALNRGKHLSEIFLLPKNEATIYVSTHLELGESDLLHYHDEPHLTFILNGGVIDKRPSLENERLSGDLMFFHAGESHQTISTSFPTKYISIQFQSDFYKKNSIIESQIQSSIKKTPTAKFNMLKIYKELFVSDEFSKTTIEMLTHSFFDNDTVENKKIPVWLKSVVEYLNDNWNQDISLEELANVVNVHPKTISKYFPRFFNCTFGEYRRKIKVEKSLSLIKCSKLSLTDVAYECGFYDQSHFTATFRDLTGFLPKQFKKL
jgi:AraC family transcriptional regulator